MDKFLVFINSIDWIFAGVILIGGRYWGSKYFKISVNPSRNFLAFATAFGLVWLCLKYAVMGAFKDEWMNLFITYLFVTSFYEVLGKRLFEWIEGIFPKYKPNNQNDN